MMSRTLSNFMLVLMAVALTDGGGPDMPNMEEMTRATTYQALINLRK